MELKPRSMPVCQTLTSCPRWFCTKTSTFFMKILLTLSTMLALSPLRFSTRKRNQRTRLESFPTHFTGSTL